MKNSKNCSIITCHHLWNHLQNSFDKMPTLKSWSTSWDKSWAPNSANICLSQTDSTVLWAWVRENDAPKATNDCLCQTRRWDQNWRLTSKSKKVLDSEIKLLLRKSTKKRSRQLLEFQALYWDLPGLTYTIPPIRDKCKRVQLFQETASFSEIQI